MPLFKYLPFEKLQIAHLNVTVGGSGHLFEDDSGTAKNKRRSAFWVETIDDEDSMSESTNTSYASSSDSDVHAFRSSNSQTDIIEKVIEDLRCSRMMMEPKIMTNYKIGDMSKSSVKTDVSVTSDVTE